MEYQIRYVAGHVEVYDRLGRFCYSSDHEQEAREEWEVYQHEMQ